MTAHPHDRFFRHIFSDPEHVAGELRTLLPAKLTAQIDWSTLELRPETYVDDKLAEQRTDLLFSVSMGDKRVFIYLLIEHQSTPDGFMPLRLLGYMVRIWEHWQREHPDARCLPPIVPMVLQHGELGWSKAMTMTDLLHFDGLDADVVAALLPFLPSFEFLLDDLSEAEDDALQLRAMTALGRLALYCLKYARRSTDMDWKLGRSGWRELLVDVLQAPSGIAAVATIMRYILEVSPTPDERVLAFARELGPRAEEAYMTGGQMLIERGREEGRLEGAAKLLLKLLGQKFGQLSSEVTERIQHASIEELDRWVERVLTAKTLEEVLS